MKALTLVLLLFLAAGLLDVAAQSGKTDKPIREKVDQELIYNNLIAVTRVGETIEGRLLGFLSDTLYIGRREGVKAVSISDLASVTIDGASEQGSKFVFGGMLTGIYAGSLFFLTDEGRKSTFINYYDVTQLILAESFYAFAGGSVGMLLDRMAMKKKSEFTFAADSAENAREVRKLRRFLSAPVNEGSKVHLSVYLSQVNSQFTRIRRENYTQTGQYLYIDWGHYGEQWHSFDLLHRATLTYEINGNTEAGIGLILFGEPQTNTRISEYFYPVPYTTIEKNISRRYDGRGYYATILYKPLSKIMPENFEFLAGGGAGYASADFEMIVDKTVTVSNSANAAHSNIKTIFRKKMPSAYLCAELKYHTFSSLSVAVQADYLFLPEKVPAIPEFNIAEMQMGGFGFGISLGIDF